MLHNPHEVCQALSQPSALPPKTLPKTHPTFHHQYLPTQHPRIHSKDVKEGKNSAKKLVASL